ncbi:MAG TPA: PP2C family protein-serine/threonine phosphatase, partial [Pyrinomonadaceae bacterium]
AIGIYFLFITLSTLRLSPSLTLTTGLLSALGYLCVTFYVQARYQDSAAPETFPFFVYLVYGGLILIAGIVGAVVAYQVRGYVIATLREAKLQGELEKINHDLEIARSIQQDLLPTKPPQLDHFEIAGWNQPADQTGGDYFDWQVLPDGQLAISIGDATGHGIGPALVSALCRAYVRASFLVDQKHDRVLEQLNGLLSHDLADDRFVTFAVVFLNPENGEVKVLSAGHGPILWYRRGRNTLEDFKAQGIPLGMIAGMPYEDSKVKSLKAGDMIVLVTDGFYEWENPESEEFGLARLKETIHEARDCSAEEVISRLFKAVKDFSKGTKQKDDLTIVVLKRKKTIAALKNEAEQEEPDTVAVPA